MLMLSQPNFATDLILVLSLFRFKYFSFGIDNEFILRVDRITGKVEVMNN